MNATVEPAVKSSDGKTLILWDRHTVANGFTFMVYSIDDMLLAINVFGVRLRQERTKRINSKRQLFVGH